MLLILVGCGRIAFDPLGDRDGTGLRGLAVGEDAGCVIRDNGTLACWGNNNEGQLGVGMVGGMELAPVTVPGLADVVHIGASSNAFFAIVDGGAMWSWGHASDMNLGVADTAPRLLPGKSPILADPIEISGGAASACARLASGGVTCWGDGDAGQLGDGLAADFSAPVTVPLPPRVTRLSMGADHACAIVDSQLSCWGMNHYGQLGVDAATSNETCEDIHNVIGPCKTSPLALPIAAATVIAAGSRHTCAVDDGTVQCWGSNEDGQLGDGTMTDSVLPILVTLPAQPIAIALQTYSSCALLVDGTAWCWGEGTFGQLGDGMMTDNPTPTRVDIATPLRAIAANVRGEHVCAIDDSDDVWCWGLNNAGQLGNNTTENAATPQRVALGDG